MTSRNIGKLLELFELSRDFTESELKLAYKDLVQVWHPDKYAHNDRLKERAEAKIKEINSAYSSLNELLGSKNNNKKPEKKPAPRKTPEPRKASYTARRAPDNRFIKSVFHASDFSESSDVAFAHALKIAVSARSKLNLLHVTSSKNGEEISEFPKVRDTLRKWGAINDKYTIKDLKNAGFKYQKVIGYHDDPVSSILHFLGEHPSDITVLATQQRKGAQRLMQKSVAETVSRDSGGMTLFIPNSGIGFVSKLDGSLNLKRVLIPVDKKPNPQIAVNAAVKFVEMFGLTECELVILFVGDTSAMPPIDIPTNNFSWKKTIMRGNVIDMILQAASVNKADLIVMGTAGHQGFLDALRGSTTEQVLRGSGCPLLAVPATRKL